MRSDHLYHALSIPRPMPVLMVNLASLGVVSPPPLMVSLSNHRHSRTSGNPGCAGSARGWVVGEGVCRAQL